MFPTLGHLISYFTGTTVHFGFPTFGMMVAMAFLAAAYVLTKEFKRKQNEGLLNKVFTEELIGKPATPSELFLNGLFGFVIGYKFLYIIINGSEFLAEPQKYLLSTEGNIIGGLILGAVFIYSKYREKNKAKLDVPKLEKRELQPYEIIGTITMIAAFAGILGAKIFHNLENPADFMADPMGSLLSVSGLTFYGGLIFGSIAVLWYAKRQGLNRVVIADSAAPGLMLAYAVGRIGCMLSGDGDWGINNTAPKPGWMSFLPDWMWSFSFPHNVAGEGIPMENCTDTYCTILPFPVYPTPFYETMMGLIIFAFLWSYRKKLNRPGLMFSVYLIFNGVERFSIEQIRVNSLYHIFGMGITQAEIISTCLIILGISGIFLSKKYSKKIS